MPSKNENAVQEAMDFEASEVNLNDLEQSLQTKLDAQFEDLNFLAEEREHINNPDHLGETVINLVWEQFMNQVASTAGEDFIKENRGLTLDLWDKAHIQDAKNFEEQKYATHNTYVDYEKRGEEYRSNFYTDPNNKPAAKQKQMQRYNETTQVWETYDNVDEEWKKALQQDYRKPYEKDRNKDKKNKFGNKTINKDHQVADATIARDAEAGAYMTIDEKVKSANSDDNLFDLDSVANQSKSDHDGEKWIKHKRTGTSGTGQTNAEYFGCDEDEYTKQDRKTKEVWEEEKKKKEAENIALGKKSQREEAFRIGGKALRTALMSLFAALIKEIIGKLVLWLKSADKSLHTLIEYIKMAIESFIGKLKSLLVSTTDSVLTTIATAIVGPVVGTIKKTITLIKQSWKSLTDAIQHIRSPENRGKPMSNLLPEVGNIVIAGLCGIGGIVLGEFIEKGLEAVLPILAVDIPILGSPANLIGMLMGAIVCGIVGAIAINLINKYVVKQQKNDNLGEQIDKKNEILNTQDKIYSVRAQKLNNTIQDSVREVADLHKKAGAYMTEILESVYDTSNKEAEKITDDALDRLLQDI